MKPLSFMEKTEAFSSAYLRCCIFIVEKAKESKGEFFTKKLYSKLISTSVLIEDFLDVHGAKNNSQWYYYRELAATVRHISLAGYAQKHIANRLEFYDLENQENFKEDGQETFAFLNDCLIKIASATLEESKRLNIPIPGYRYNPHDFMKISTGTMLDYDISDINKDSQKKNIVKIASEFLSVANDFNKLRFYEPYSVEKIKEIVPLKVNEVEMRRFEMLVHNLQSSFDSYVIHGGPGGKFGNIKLKRLRSSFSVAFHLIQEIGRMLHFYERHLYRTGYKNVYQQVREKLAALVNPEKLLDRMINYGLFYACHFLDNGKKLAKEILNENMERTSIIVPIPKDRGFHSRPSLLVAKIARHYGGEVKLCIRDHTFDAGSVLDLQWAGGKIEKEKIKEVVFTGDSRALNDIKTLASVNYAEDRMGKGKTLPKELSYL